MPSRGPRLANHIASTWSGGWIKQLAVVRKLVLPTPTTLDLLRYPLNESDGKTNTRTSRTNPAKMPVGVAN
jgi:hypothetical protein